MSADRDFGNAICGDSWRYCARKCRIALPRFRSVSTPGLYGPCWAEIQQARGLARGSPLPAYSATAENWFFVSQPTYVRRQKEDRASSPILPITRAPPLVGDRKHCHD